MEQSSGAGPRSAVVVGGASGIGWATAQRLATDGWRLVVADIDTAAAEERARSLPGGAVETHRAAHVDVVDEASVEALLTSAGADGTLQLVVNCAGVSTMGLVVEHDAAEWRRVVDVCLNGGFLVVKHAGQHLAEGGSVVSVASLNARQPGVGMGAYCAAKAGLVMLTEVAALELGPRGIRVNAVSPGLVPTPLTAPALDIPGIEDDYLENTPLGRSGSTEEVAEAIAYLADAHWVTGTNLDINGGAHLKRYPDIHGHVMRAFS